MHYQLESGRGGTVLVVELDDEWLDDPQRVWPVYVDPTVSDFTAMSDDTHVNSCYTGNYSSLSYFKVGGAPCQRAGYAKWDLSLIPGAKIFEANIAAWNGYSYSCSPRNVSVYRVTQAWGGSTMTGWPGATFHPTPVVSRSFANGYNANCPGNWQTFPVTQLVQDWVSGTAPNFGVTYRVNATTTSDAHTYKEFASSGAYGLHVLQVRWTPYVPVWNVADTMTQDVTNNQSGYVSISIGNGGPAYWNATGTNPYRIAYHVYDYQTGDQVLWDGVRTNLPADVPFMAWQSVSARIAPLPPGEYIIHWDVLREGLVWFSRHWDNPTHNAPIFVQQLRVVNLRPQVGSVSPGNGSVLQTRTPTFTLTGLSNPDAWPSAVVQTRVQFCPTRAETSSCVTGPWANASSGGTSWTPSTGVGWGDGHWRYQLREAQPQGMTAPWSAWRGVSMAPPPADNDAAPPAGAPAVHGVDVYSRSFSTHQIDASTEDAGFPVSVVRNYNSAVESIGAFGRGWVSPIDFRLQLSELPDGVGAILHRGEGRIEHFGEPRAGSDTLVAPHTSMTSLKQTASGYVLTNADGSVHEFDTSGFPTSTSSTDGRGYTYGSAGGQVTSLTSTLSGRTLNITWAGDRVSQIATEPIAANGNAPYTWTYGYSSGRLAEVCGPNSSTACTEYGYALVDGSWLLTTVTQPEGNTTIEVDYVTSGSHAGTVESVTVGGGTWTFSSSSASSPKTVTITNPDSNSVQWESDAAGRLIRHRNENGDDRLLSYNPAGFLAEVVDEAGNIVRYTTDSAGNRLSESLYSPTAGGEVHEGSTHAGYLRYLDPADPRNHLLSWRSDARAAGPDDHTYRTRYLYTPNGDVAAVTDPLGTRPYQAEVLSDGPRIYWRGTSDGTTVLDSAGSGHPGTSTGAVGATTGPTPDLSAFSFAGTDGVVTAEGDGVPSTHGLVGAADRTVEAWVRAHSFNGGGVFEMGSLDAGEYFALRTHPDVDDRWQIQLGNQSVDADVPGSKGEWVHIAVTYDGTTVRFYANGAEVASSETGLATGIDRELSVGRVATGHLHGDIAEFALFNRALTPGRISAHFAAQNLGWSRTAFSHYTDGSEPAPGGGTMPPDLLTHTVDTAGMSSGVTAYRQNGDIASVTWPSGATVTYSGASRFSGV